ncbi:MAG: T9SS type A sorting domain-containing protein, partial [bacterium]
AMTSPITINIYYPSSIIEQKWNNVLALLNSNYNGGYTFSSYQWYCNGSAIKNAEGSYYYLGENSSFSTSDEYHVVVTRADDNVTMPSCAINPVKKVDVNDYLTAVTTRVSMGETFTLPQIESEQSYTVRIYTSVGSLVSVQRVESSNASITAPRVQGIYIVSLEFTSGISSYKLFVE